MENGKGGIKQSYDNFKKTTVKYLTRATLLGVFSCATFTCLNRGEIPTTVFPTPSPKPPTPLYQPQYVQPTPYVRDVVEDNHGATCLLIRQEDGLGVASKLQQAGIPVDANDWITVHSAQGHSPDNLPKTRRYDAFSSLGYNPVIRYGDRVCVKSMAGTE